MQSWDSHLGSTVTTSACLNVETKLGSEGCRTETTLGAAEQRYMTEKPQGSGLEIGRRMLLVQKRADWERELHCGEGNGGGAGEEFSCGARHLRSVTQRA